MTKAEAIKYSLINILIIFLGALIAFKVWWTNDSTRLFGVISFFLIGFGSLFLSISLTRIIVPSTVNFNFSTLSDSQKYKIFKKTIGDKKVRIINLTYIFLFSVLFAITTYTLVLALNKYEQFQLINYGQIQKVIIKDIHHKGKGAPYAFFDFHLDGKIHTTDLSSSNYNIGDSVNIIFSTNDIDIVKWEDAFDKNR